MHGFLQQIEGIDFENKVKMGIRNNRYDAMVPTVTGALRLPGRVHQAEARLLRAHTNRKIKFTLPGPMTIVDTLADRYYGDRNDDGLRLRRAAERGGTRAGSGRRGRHPVRRAGLQCLHGGRRADGASTRCIRRSTGLRCTTAVHICYGYGIEANIRLEADAWARSGASTSRCFPPWRPAGSIRCRWNAPTRTCRCELMELLAGKDVLVGVIDVATDTVETPEDVAATIAAALRYVPAERLLPCTNCGMAPMDRGIASPSCTPCRGRAAGLRNGIIVRENQRFVVSGSVQDVQDDQPIRLDPVGVTRRFVQNIVR